MSRSGNFPRRWNRAATRPDSRRLVGSERSQYIASASGQSVQRGIQRALYGSQFDGRVSERSAMATDDQFSEGYFIRQDPRPDRRCAIFRVYQVG